jgi:hypothetical protein
MVEVTRLWRRCHRQWHHLPTKFHENPPIGSNVNNGDTQTDRQTDRLVILQASFRCWMTEG